MMSMACTVESAQPHRLISLQLYISRGELAGCARMPIVQSFQPVCDQHETQDAHAQQVPR